MRVFDTTPPTERTERTKDKAKRIRRVPPKERTAAQRTWLGQFEALPPAGTTGGTGYKPRAAEPAPTEAKEPPPLVFDGDAPSPAPAAETPASASPGPQSATPRPVAKPVAPEVTPEQRARELERWVTLVMSLHKGTGQVLEKHTGMSVDSFIPGANKLVTESWRFAVEDHLPEGTPSRTIAPWIALIATSINVIGAVWVLWQVKKAQDVKTARGEAPAKPPEPAKPEPTKPAARPAVNLGQLGMQPKAAPAPAKPPAADPAVKEIRPEKILADDPFKAIPVSSGPERVV